MMHLHYLKSNGELLWRFIKIFFEDEFTITLRVTGKTSKSISYEILFTKDGDEIANGGLTICCVCRDDTGAMKATDIPPDLAAKIEVAADN